MIKTEWPPNIERIANAFPHVADAVAGKVPVRLLFAYGEDIYNPSGIQIPGPLLVHEYRHCARQWQADPQAWWNKYIEDDEFRYDEELVAHVEEYRAQLQGTQRNYRRLLLKFTAKRLTASLYRYDISLERAMRDIKQLAR